MDYLGVKSATANRILTYNEALAANSVTYAMIQTVANNKLLGNVSGSTANVAEITLDTDGTLAANSDSVVATQKAVKTYVTANAGGGNNPLMVQIFS